MDVSIHHSQVESLQLSIAAPFYDFPASLQVPILILANKQDLPGARDPGQIEQVLSIAELGNTHLWHIQVTL